MVFQQILLENAYFIAKMPGLTMVRPASSGLWKAPLDLVLVDTREKISFPEMSVGSFSNDDGDGDGNENVKKAIGLLSKTTSLHVHNAFL